MSFCNVYAFPCFNNPRYEARVSGVTLGCKHFFSILRLVAVRKVRCVGKCTHPKKSTPDAIVLMNTLLGCNTRQLKFPHAHQNISNVLLKNSIASSLYPSHDQNT